jgi:Flp pilus assembly protein TadD
LKINPNDVTALIRLAQLEAANKNTARALTLAKAARQLAPADAAIGYALGRLVYQSGDYAWAASVLQDAARNLPPTPDLQFDLALADYSVGQVADAETAMRGALAGGGIFLRAEEARRFLNLVNLAAHPAEAASQSALVEQTLAGDPANVPALMATGAISEQRPDPEAARRAYEKVLGLFPTFVPAKARLAVLASQQAESDDKAFGWAQEARTAYPTDPDVARALGVLTFRRKDFAHAIPLLKESLAAHDHDAEAWYYLGVSQQRQAKPAESRAALQRALDQGLAGDHAADARKVLAESK